MRADADQHQISGLIERYSFFAYSGCCGTFDFGSDTLASLFLMPSSISLVRLHDPHRLAAPFDGHHLARLELADVDFDRRAGRLGALRWHHAADERHRRRRRGDAADHTGARSKKCACSCPLPSHTSNSPLKIWAKSGIIANAAQKLKQNLKNTCRFMDLQLRQAIAAAAAQTGFSMSMKPCSRPKRAARCSPSAWMP